MSIEETRPIIVIVLGAVLLVTGRADAQNAEAEALFNEGDRLETSGKIDQACDAFEASNRIERRAGAMIRLGQCRERQNKIASAWSAYKDSLTRVQDPAKKQIAEAKIAELEPKLSFLTVLVPDESRIDGLIIKRDGVVLDPFLLNRGAPVDGGRYVISGEAPGHEPWSTTIEVAPTGAKASVEVPRFKELHKLVVTTPDSDDSDEPPVVPGPFTTTRKIAVGVAGIAVVALGAGVLLGVDARSKQDRALELCPDPMRCAAAAQAQDVHDQARSRALAASISFGAASAAAVTAIVLWLSGAPSESAPTDVAIGARIGSGIACFALGWRF
jgi:hypothetical protein